MKTTIVLMAAGIGSRFGGGIKQLEPVGLNDKIIMDYSMHDAIKVGFNKVIFIIRKDIESEFKERISLNCSSKVGFFLRVCLEISMISGLINSVGFSNSSTSSNRDNCPSKSSTVSALC